MGIEKEVYVLNKWLNEDEKMPLLCASDTIALPSIYEPFGIVALEGLAADYACEINGLVGPVVVVGNTGGMEEIIKSGTDGLEVPIENFKINPQFLAEILRVSVTNEKLREKISKNGAERVMSKYFNWDFIVRQIFKIYRNARRNFTEAKRFGV